MSNYIEMLDLDGLNQKLAELQQEAQRHSLWTELADSALGRRLIASQKERLDIIRSGYAHIPVNSEYTSRLLAGIQGKEEEALALLRMLEDAIEHKKGIDAEVGVVLGCMTRLQEGQEERASSIVARAAILEIDGDST